MHARAVVRGGVAVRVVLLLLGRLPRRRHRELPGVPVRPDVVAVLRLQRRRLHLRGRRLRHLRPAPPPRRHRVPAGGQVSRWGAPRPAAQRRQRGVPDAGQPVRPRDVRGGRGGVPALPAGRPRAVVVRQPGGPLEIANAVALLLLGPAALQHRQCRPPRRARHRGHVRPHVLARVVLAQRHVPRPREARDATPALRWRRLRPQRLPLVRHRPRGEMRGALVAAPRRHRADLLRPLPPGRGREAVPRPHPRDQPPRRRRARQRQRGVVARRPRERPAGPPLLRRRRPERPQARRERADGGALPVGGDADGEDTEGPAEPDLRARPRARVRRGARRHGRRRRAGGVEFVPAALVVLGGVHDGPRSDERGADGGRGDGGRRVGARLVWEARLLDAPQRAPGRRRRVHRDGRRAGDGLCRCPTPSTIPSTSHTSPIPPSRSSAASSPTSSSSSSSASPAGSTSCTRGRTRSTC